MKVEIKFDCNNAAFDDEDFSEEIRKVLARAYIKILDNYAVGNVPYVKWSNIHDSNGNVVGQCRISEGEPK